MDLYRDILVNRKGIKNIYDTYLVEVKGIFFDRLSTLNIIYVMEGEVEIYIKGHKIKYKKGEIIILNQFENKFIYSEKENLLLVLNISSKYLYELGDVYYLTRFYNKMEDPVMNNVILKNLIILYHCSDHLNKRDVNINIVKSLIQILIRNISISPEINNGLEEKSYFVYEVEKFIEFDKKNNMNLQIMADELHVSNSHLSKIFSEMTGINFTEYIQQLRLFYATSYLLNTRINLDEISEIVGLGSPKSLNRIFVKYLHITPAKYRKVFMGKKEIFDQSNSLIELFGKFEALSYSEFIEKDINYVKEHVINLNIDPEEEDKLVDFRSLNIFQSWDTIVNLNRLGYDIIHQLTDLLKYFNLREMLLRFDLRENTLVLQDIEREITEYELSDLLSVCIENDLKLVIGLNFNDVNEDSNIEELINMVITRTRKFCNIMSNAVGTNAMKNFTYLINMDLLYKFIDDSEKTIKYMDLVQNQQEVIMKKLKTDKIRWGYELGEFSEKYLDKFIKISEYMNEKESKYHPEIVSLSYKASEYSNVTNILELGQLKNNFKKMLDKTENIYRENYFKIDKVYVRNAFMNIDISDVNYLYRDLFMASLMLNSTTVLFNETNFIPDFRVIDKNQPSGFYHPSYKDISNFYTPIYWVSLMMYYIQGKLLYKNEGTFVTKCEDDIFVMTYGNVVSDYLFAKQNEVEKLENKYREVDYIIKGLHGKYKITTVKISFENGTSGYHLKNHDNYKFLTTNEKRYIRRIAVPLVDTNIKDLHGVYKEKVKIAPFNFILKRYTKI